MKKNSIKLLAITCAITVLSVSCKQQKACAAYSKVDKIQPLKDKSI